MPPRPSPPSSPAPSQPCTPLTGARDTVRKACQLTSQSAYHVDGPSFESTVSPALRWTSRTFASVPAPKRPSASIPAFFCQRFSPCAPDDLPEPKISPGFREFGVLPDTDSIGPEASP